MKQVLLIVGAALVLSACEDLDEYYGGGGPSSYYGSPYYGSPYYGGPYDGYHRHHYRDHPYGDYGGYYGPYDGR